MRDQSNQPELTLTAIPTEPVVSDGEQAKSSFATYPLDGLNNLAPDGVIIP